MPSKDIIHEAVKKALQKDGWTITADPYLITLEDVQLYADLGAERSLAAERAGSKIVVEIKSFLSLSPLRDFEEALGQYILYRDLLEITAPERKLYLAISDVVQDRVFERPVLRAIVQKHQMALLLVNILREEMVQWIEQPPTVL